jgi:hypothetical protein
MGFWTVWRIQKGKQICGLDVSRFKGRSIRLKEYNKLWMINLTNLSGLVHKWMDGGKMKLLSLSILIKKTIHRHQFIVTDIYLFVSHATQARGGCLLIG